MTRIEAFENQLIADGLKDDSLAQLAVLLRRVHDPDLQLQHCYATAMRFPPERCHQAIRLIIFGMDAYPTGSWWTKYRCYLSMGSVYANAGEYRAAYQTYLLAQEVLETSSLGTSTMQSYRENLSIELLWVKLHANGFRYSPDLEEYYRLTAGAGAFERAFLQHRFCSALAEIVVALHHRQLERARAAYECAMTICKPDYHGALYQLLKKHQYEESLRMTDEARAYLQEVGPQLSL